MSDRHPLDDFLQSKLAEEQIPFQERYWEAASLLLDQQRKRRKVLLWIWCGLGVGLGMGAMWGIFIHGSATPQKSALATAVVIEQTSPREPDSCLVSELKHDTSRFIASSLQSSAEKITERDARRETKRESRRDSAHQAGGEADNSSRHASDRDPASMMDVRFSSAALYDQLSKSSETLPAAWEREMSLQAIRHRKAVLQLGGWGALPPPVAGEWRQHRHTWGMMLGGQLAPAWQGPSAMQASATPLIGVFGTWALRPGLRLEGGLLYQGRTALQRDSSFTSVSFGFGREESSITLASQSLHFLSFPFGLHARLASRHSLSAGIELSWLGGIYTRVSSTSTSGNQPAESYSWNYPQGYRRWDVALQAGYFYSLGQGLRVGTVVSYGIRDLTDNTYFTQGLVDRQAHGRIILLQSLGRQ